MLEIDTSFGTDHLEYLDWKLREKTGIKQEMTEKIRDQKALQPDYIPQTA